MVHVRLCVDLAARGRDAIAIGKAVKTGVEVTQARFAAVGRGVGQLAVVASASRKHKNNNARTNTTQETATKEKREKRICHSVCACVLETQNEKTNKSTNSLFYLRCELLARC